MSMLKTECNHADQIVEGMQPRATLCEECGSEGPLRFCATCGYVGC